MKIKFQFIVGIVFLAFMPTAYTQFDVTQLEALQMLNQEDTDVDDPIDPFQDKEILDEPDIEKDQNNVIEAVNDFGYQGRNDFLVAPKTKFAKEPLMPFGYDYFINKQNNLLSTNETPIPPDYILGPGDIVKIILFGSKNEKYSLQVTREGDIFIPEIGPVSIAGLTFSDMKETINQIIDNQLIGTKVSITLGDLRAINIFVLGEALNPGMYTVSALSTLTNAVFANGGIKNTGSLRNIQLKRNGEILSTFDFYDVLLRGDTRNDLRLMTGDVVFIPPITKKIGVIGEVERPGIYELKENETANDLINFAGTLTPKADLTSVEIQSIDSFGNGFNLNKVDLNKTSFSDLSLGDGDILTIYPILNRMKNAILLSGHTQKRGFYPWKDGMRLSDVISSSDDLLPMTDINYVLIKRQNHENQKYQIFQANLEDLFDKSNNDADLTLKEKDEIIFFPAMLSKDLINVDLIDADYENDDEQRILAEQRIFSDEADTPLILDEERFARDEKIFKYTIHDYCSFNSDEYAEALLDEKPVIALTNHCRRQALDPIINILVQQGEYGQEPKVFDVFGKVDFPGRYPLGENSILKDVFNASGGINSDAYLNEIEITSRNFSGKEMLRKTIKTSFLTNSRNTNIAPMDQITIKSMSTESEIVTISGEVFFPGSYPVTKKENLSDLIARAGGLKENADIRAAIFQREALKLEELDRLEKLKQEAKRNLLLSQQSFGADQEDQLDLASLEKLIDSEIDEDDLGRLIINLESILSGNADLDVDLENGDKLHIPRLSKTVSVIGEVYVPNSHLISSESSLKNYIELSGGFTDYADEENIYIIRSDGSVAPQNDNGGFFRANNSGLKPGDTIVVPVKLDRFSALKATTDITQIIYQMSLAAAAVNSF